jgi:hypothetical protein
VTAELLTHEQHAAVLAQRPRAHLIGGPACGSPPVECLVREFRYTPPYPTPDPDRSRHAHLYTLAHKDGSLVYLHSFVDIAPNT